MVYVQGSVAIKAWTGASRSLGGDSMAAPRAWLAMRRAKVEMMADLKSILDE